MSGGMRMFEMRTHAVDQSSCKDYHRVCKRQQAGK